MKQLTLFIGLMLLLCVPVSGQQNTAIETYTYVDLELSNTGNDTVDTVYLLFPNERDTWYMSETLPTSTIRRDHRAYFAGGCGIMVEYNSSAGADDSLRIDMRPLVWDEKDNEYAVIEADVTYLVMGQANVYSQSTRDYFDVTDAVEEHIYLTGLVWNYEGVEFEVHCGDEGTFSTTVTLQPHIVQ